MSPDQTEAHKQFSGKVAVSIDTARPQRRCDCIIMGKDLHAGIGQLRACTALIARQAIRVGFGLCREW
jgi:hypothetical protein